MRPCLGVSEHPPNPQFQGLKTDLCGYHRRNYFSRSVPEYQCNIIQVRTCTPTNAWKVKSAMIAHTGRTAFQRFYQKIYFGFKVIVE